jgi:hypothetical protein
MPLKCEHTLGGGPWARGEFVGNNARCYYPHLALSGALSGPDSATLQRTVLFCRRHCFLTVKVIQIQKKEQVLLSSEIYARGSYHVLQKKI